MKREWEILDKYHGLDVKLKKKQNEYIGLDQISMGSGEGNEILSEINKIKGEIKAFKWVLDIK